MNKTGFISEQIKNATGPFIYKDGKCILTYEELAKEITKKNNYESGHRVLSWKPQSNKSFIIEYFRLIESGVTPILVDDRRLQLSPTDYQLDNLVNTKLDAIESEQSCASVIFTSGSTGKPKGVRLSLESLINSASATVRHYQIEQRDNWALSLPLFHIGGIMIVWRSLIAKSSLTIVDAAELDKDLLNNSQITICSLVQLQLARLMDSEELIERMRKLKGIVLGGSKISSSLIQKATDSGIFLSNSFGASESCAQFLATPFTKDNQLLSTCGKPMDGRVSIIDSKCVLEGKSIAIGYINGDDFDQKYFTNDLIKIDKDGNYTILGRSDFVFQKAAENINPEIIEQKLSKHFNNAYISPIKNEKYENLIALTYCDNHSLTDAQNILENELISFERPHLIFKANDLNDLQVGVKISREKIESLVNSLFLEFNEDFYLSAQGNPNGDIIFVGHGFMGDALELEDVTKQLAKKYLLIYIDLPGHGKNQKLTSLELFKDRLISSIKKIEAKGQRQVHFITYSMSGRIFNEILRDKQLANTESIKIFVNESGAPGFTAGQEDRDKRLKHDSNLFNDANKETFFHTWYDQGVFKNIKQCPDAQLMLKKKEADFAKYFKSWQRVSPMLSVAKQKDLRNLNELPHGLSYHYICGEQDEKYKSYCKAYTASNHVDYHYHIVEGASHNIHFMNKENYLNLLKKIFKS